MQEAVKQAPNDEHAAPTYRHRDEHAAHGGERVPSTLRQWANRDWQKTARGPNGSLRMKLVPPQPPGRMTRKARAFESEIVQLRLQGYTLEAIRQALAGAGVNVSISTVRREALRHAAPTPGPGAAAVTLAGSNSPNGPPRREFAAPGLAPAPAAAISLAESPPMRSGREVAEEFMRDRIANPLIRSKERQ